MQASESQGSGGRAGRSILPIVASGSLRASEEGGVAFAGNTLVSLQVLVNLIEAKDAFLAGHSARIAGT